MKLKIRWERKDLYLKAHIVYQAEDLRATDKGVLNIWSRDKTFCIRSCNSPAIYCSDFADNHKELLGQKYILYIRGTHTNRDYALPSYFFMCEEDLLSFTNSVDSLCNELNNDFHNVYSRRSKSKKN